ncbi:MAG: Nitrogen regulation protein [Labilithrix sp.]|nr:Nitrogen regulation protein [Labilithrix sp.]
MPKDDAIVFVVDDDTFVRQALEELARSAGWNAETFDSAAGFLGRAKPDVPHCVLLDLELPGLCGLELQRRMLRDGYEDTPVIFVSGRGDVATSVRAMKAGAMEFLTKPLSYDVVVDNIVVAGHLNKQVAGELGITEGTVKVHRAQVMTKMQADSLATLVRMALMLDGITSLRHSQLPARGNQIVTVVPAPGAESM